MTAQALERVTFSTSRAADFLEARALVSQTGQPVQRFGDVVLKELLDNALDACESARVVPEVTVTVRTAGQARLVTVEDNGAGLPAEVVARILDYSTLTSDKALYRSPARGAQGNALKTLIGVPHALGLDEPVVIEAQAVRHTITVALDMAGNVVVRHDQDESRRAAGTSVTVPLPALPRLTGVVERAAWWVRAYALVNPHATFHLRGHGDDPDAGTAETYKATAADGWRKPLPGDPTSAWWYDAAAFTKLAGSLAVLGDDRPLGAFIGEFRGLSSTAKRRQIAAVAPDVRRVRDITGHPESAGVLLQAMQAASTQPTPGVLGQVPEDHYRALLDRLYGVERFWYRAAGLVCGGIAWHVEAAVAVTRGRGDTVYAANYGVAFGDPLGAARLRTAEVSGWGAADFLERCEAGPTAFNDFRRAAVVHVACAAPVFTDKGKTRLVVPDEVADLAARVLGHAGRDLRREARNAERAEAAQRRAEHQAQRTERREAARPGRPSQKDAVFEVLPEAIRLQREGTDLPFSAHSLFYKIRPLFQALLPGATLTSKYCEQTLIPAYEREHGEIEGMYREARGELHEPHDANGERTVRLGTREVLLYQPPAWTYDKVLVVEKAGLWPVLKASRLADRFDIAVAVSEGFAAEAPRKLIAALHSRDMRTFVLHDADHPGCEIARTLGEATTRMPGHHVEVIDLGLAADDAIRLGLEPETYYRDRALPGRLLPRLSAAALDWFSGTPCEWDGRGRPKRWRCRRVELNAMSSPGLVAFIEDGLRLHGADTKVVPPADVLSSHARDVHRQVVTSKVRSILDELVDAEAIAAQVAVEAAAGRSFSISPGAVREILDRRREMPWEHAVASVMAGRPYAVDLRQRVADLLHARGIDGGR